MHTDSEIYAISTAYTALAKTLSSLDIEGDVIVERLDWDIITEAIANLEEAFPEIIEEARQVNQDDSELPEDNGDDGEALASAGRGTDEDYQPGEYIG